MPYTCPGHQVAYGLYSGALVHCAGECVRVVTLKDRFHREWACQVVDSGFHSGAGCSPGDHHTYPWNCGFKWKAQPLSDAVAAQFGLTEE